MQKTAFTASRIERECPHRHYIFERHSRKKLKLAVTDIKELTVTNRTECEDRYEKKIHSKLKTRLMCMEKIVKNSTDA